VQGAAVLGGLTPASGAGAGPPARRPTWLAARVTDVVRETPHAATLVLDVPRWPGHRAGQYVIVRLTAEGGSQAQRSYSIASAPEEERLRLTVGRLADGAVSAYLVDALRAGDELELCGPLGEAFVWEAADGGPLLLVAGGWGLVPLMAMLRHRAAVGSRVPARVVLSARSAEDVLYADELERLAAEDDDVDVVITYTRRPPAVWSGPTGRVDQALLARLTTAPAERPLTFVCGPTGFVESVAGALVALGHDPALVRMERFGPAGP
jgi:ferredoxin-NADP reductase